MALNWLHMYQADGRSTNKPKAIFWSVLTLISGYFLAVSPFTGVGLFGRHSPFWVAPSILCLLLFYGSLMTCVRAWGWSPSNDG